MKPYKKVLFAVDLLPKGDNSVAERVEAVLKNTDAELVLVHVIEPMTYTYIEPLSSASYLELQAQIEASVSENIGKIAKRFNVPSEKIHMPTGRPQDLILEVAKQEKVDLIILGSHGKSGWRKLVLGSVANGVLQGATCDVLAVRVKGES